MHESTVGAGHNDICLEHLEFRQGMDDSRTARVHNFRPAKEGIARLS